jgi:serine protease Do
MRQITRHRLTLGAAATVCVAALGAVALAQHSSGGLPPASLPPGIAAAPTRGVPASPPVARLEELSDAFAAVAERVKPSVVYITAREAPRRLARGGSAPAPRTLPQLPPEFREFFRGLPALPDAPRMTPPGGGVSSGSGFIVSPDGYILTNAHVLDGADRVTVRLLDRREFPAKVVGRDPTTDVAVVKIDATGLTPAPLGNSDAARVGEWVLAVGNPLGEQLTFTVTQGIISAKGRSSLALPNVSHRSIQDFIQTDAAINPGNSGGPLVNVRGEVIGINSAIASPTGYNAGYGFAVPIDLARAVMDQLIRTGRVERAALGVTVRDATAEDAAYAGLPAVSGVRVEDYGSEDSPAKRAGIEPGDVIVSVDGRPVTYVAQLQEAIAFRKPGDVVSVGVARKGGQRATVRVSLQRADADRTAADDAADDENAADPAGRDGHSVPALGVSGVATDDPVGRDIRLPHDVRGVVVLDVTDVSPAAGRLLTPDAGGPDVILSVEGTAVRTPQELRSVLARYRSGDIVTLRVHNARSGTRRVERVRLGPPTDG